MSMPIDTLLTHTFLTIFYDVSAAFAINFFEIFLILPYRREKKFPAVRPHFIFDLNTKLAR